MNNSSYSLISRLDRKKVSELKKIGQQKIFKLMQEKKVNKKYKDEREIKT